MKNTPKSDKNLHFTTSQRLRSKIVYLRKSTRMNYEYFISYAIELGSIKEFFNCIVELPNRLDSMQQIRALEHQFLLEYKLTHAPDYSYKLTILTWNLVNEK